MSDTKFTAEASRTASDTLAKKSTSSDVVSVSYTHLTLPTICSV